MVGDCTDPRLFRGHISVSWDFRQSLAIRYGRHCATHSSWRAPEQLGRNRQAWFCDANLTLLDRRAGRVQGPLPWRFMRPTVCFGIDFAPDAHGSGFCSAVLKAAAQEPVAWGVAGRYRPFAAIRGTKPRATQESHPHVSDCHCS